jgi:hypothetical protein
MLDRSRRALALGLACTIVAVIAGPPAPADGAILSGKVFQADGATPRSGVVVQLVDPRTERSFPSATTREDGAFRIEGAPAGTYRVLAETPAGAFLAGDSVTVSPGANRPVSLTLQEAPPAPPTPADPTTASTGGLPTWGKWLIAGGIAVGALFVINEVTDEEDEPASPS